MGAEFLFLGEPILQKRLEHMLWYGISDSRTSTDARVKLIHH